MSVSLSVFSALLIGR